MLPGYVGEREHDAVVVDERRRRDDVGPAEIVMLRKRRLKRCYRRELRRVTRVVPDRAEHPHRDRERVSDDRVRRDRLVRERVLPEVVVDDPRAGDRLEVREEVVELKVLRAAQEPFGEVDRFSDRNNR